MSHSTFLNRYPFLRILPRVTVRGARMMLKSESYLPETFH